MYLRWMRGEMSCHTVCVARSCLQRLLRAQCHCLRTHHCHQYLHVLCHHRPALCPQSLTSDSKPPVASQSAPAPFVRPKAESFSRTLPAAPPESSDSDDDAADPLDVILCPVTSASDSWPRQSPTSCATWPAHFAAVVLGAITLVQWRACPAQRLASACHAQIPPGRLVGVRRHGEPTPDPLHS